VPRKAKENLSHAVHAQYMTERSSDSLDNLRTVYRMKNENLSSELLEVGDGGRSWRLVVALAPLTPIRRRVEQLSASCTATSPSNNSK
jgi:hypothetical protein